MMDKEGLYDAHNIWVPGCTFETYCVSRDNDGRTRFCLCLKNIGIQRMNNKVTVTCDKLEVVDEKELE